MKSDNCIVQLSRGAGPSIHRYYDVPVEEPGGTRILYFEFASDKIPGPGRLLVAEADGSKPRIVGEALYAIGHAGAGAAWVGPGRIAFSPNRPHDLTTIIRDLDGSNEVLIHGGARSICERTGRVLIMRVTGGPADGASGDSILERWDPDTGRQTTILTAGTALAMHPWRDCVPGAHTNLMNAKWSPDGERLFVVFTTEIYRRTHSESPTPYVKALYVLDADGANARYLCEFTHHPMWTPDGQGIIAYRHHDTAQDLVKIHLADGSMETLLEDAPGVHATLDRAGRRLVTDVHNIPGRHASILLIDLHNRQTTTLAHGPHHDFDHITGTHPHPQWSRDESHVFFNLARTGSSQLYAVKV